jgi:cell wall-associated NlpC family hydrolase
LLATTPPAPFSEPTLPSTRAAWATALLGRLGNAQPTQATVAMVVAWHRAEGGTATFNWLNTTEDAPGATMYNCLNPDCTIGVRNYPDFETGIEATAATLTNGRYPRTLAGLVGNLPVIDDQEMATWGTGGGAIRAQLAIVPENGAQQATGGVRAELVDYALGLVGIPYVRGGRSATGGDCSGTMQHVYLAVTGIDIGGTTFSQWPGLEAVDAADLHPGDLWYGQYANDQHVGMVAGDLDGDGTLDLINNGGLQDSMHVDYSFMDNPYFYEHTMGYRRAL